MNTVIPPNDVLRFTTYKRIARNVEEAYAIIKGMNLPYGQPVEVPFYYYDKLDTENGHGKTKVKIAFGIGSMDATQPYIQTNIEDDAIVERIKELYVDWTHYGMSTLTVGCKDASGNYDGTLLEVNGVVIGSLNIEDNPDLFEDETHIKTDANILDILTAMLNKVCTINVTYPSVDASFTWGGLSVDSSTILPIGESVTLSPSYVYDEGSFTGCEGYDYDVSTGCSELTDYSPEFTIYEGDTSIFGSVGTGNITFNVPDSSDLWIGCRVYHSASITPVDNYGTEVTEMVIPRGFCDEWKMKLNTGYRVYKGSLGNGNINTVSDIDNADWENLVGTSDIIEKSDDMYIVSADSSVVTNGYGYYMIVPDGMEIGEVCSPLVGLNSVMSDMISGSSTTTMFDKSYRVFLMPYTSGNKVVLSSIKMNKE